MIPTRFKIYLTACFLAIAAYPSASTVPDNMSLAKDLYNKGMYSEAAVLFNSVGGSEADGFRVLCLTKMRSRGYEDEISNYETAYPASGLLSLIRYNYGLNLFDEENYRKAVPLLDAVKPGLLSPREQSELLFKLGYASYKNDDRDGALYYLTRLSKSGRSDYSAPGAYLAGYINYEKEDFRRAEQWFEISRKDPRHAELSQYYIIDGRFHRKDYDYVLKHAPLLYEKVSQEHKAHLARIISESYLVRGNVSKARDYYALSGGNSSDGDRNELFYAGSLMYASGNYQEAISNFEKMPALRDSIGQIAEYQLSYSYIKTGNKVAALGHFKAAADLPFDDAIREDAFFNSAKLSFDLNHDASVFNDYMKAYPSKEKNEQIYEYMALAALYEKDYVRAIEAYDNIEELGPSQRSNYVKANYLRAQQLISGNSWRAAVPYLTAVSYYSNRHSGIYQLSRFWIAEASFREGDMQKSRAIYNELYNISALDNRPEGKVLPYNIAYTYMREDNLAMARRWLGTYISSGDRQLRKDAMLRLADCFYVDKLYPDAAKAYHAVSEEFGSSQDAYSLYQEAMAEGLSSRQTAKISVLRGALSLPPLTPYRSEAVMELGRTYVSAGRSREAATCYEKLVLEAKDTAYMAQALIGLAMISAGEQKFEEASLHYKRVIENLPESQYTQDALMALEAVYQSMGRSEEYVAYIESLGHKGSRSEQDKERILFGGAEQSYINGDYSKALSSFIAFNERYPAGRYRGQVLYFIASCHSRLGNKDIAVDAYKEAVAAGSGSYRESAAGELAALLLDMERFTEAYSAYKEFLSSAGFESNIHLAKIGMMNSSYKARMFEECIASADEVISDAKSEASETTQAKYLKAKSLQSLSRRDEAYSLYRELSAAPAGSYGAEAMYLLILDAYDSGRYGDVEKLVFEFAEKGGSQNYYKAKAFIVLGDSYADREEFRQARATFESILNGYKPASADDEIIPEVKLRLEKIDEITKENQE